MDIFIGKKGLVFGPYYPDEVRKRMDEARFDGSELAWHEGLEGWTDVKMVVNGVAPQESRSTQGKEGIETAPLDENPREQVRQIKELVADDDPDAAWQLIYSLNNSRIYEELLKDCIRANRGNPITFFEMTTAAAFVAFARVPADVVLIETGLGGRLDATNLITQPYLTILTPISIDHQFHLGHRLMQIATEKAAILKSHCPAIVGAQTQSALRVITRVARARAVPLWRQNYEWRLRHRAFGTVFESTAARRLFPIPGLVGNHQRDNAGIAVASLDQMPEFTVLDSALRVGLTQVEWPARLQLLASGSLTRNVPLDVQLWVDGGHNAAAGTALADVVRTHLMNRPLRLIVGMLENKSPEEFLAPLAPYVERFWGISIAGESNSISAANLTNCARRLGLTVEQAPNILAAIKAASLTQSHVLICGSLYLAGQVLAANNGALDGRP